VRTQRGAIIWATVDDPNGHPILDSNGDPKPHPVVVLSRTDEILAGMPITVAVISTRFDATNLQSGEFLIPSSPGGHPVTGLDQPSVVKSYWLAELDEKKVTRAHPRERAPARVVKQALNWLAQHT
jgi:hypothetical protein